jgi:hypothetical protein
MRKTLFKCSEKKLVAIETSDFEGEPWVALRTFVKKKDGTWTRTRNGLSIPARHFAELQDALNAIDTRDVPGSHTRRRA